MAKAAVRFFRSARAFRVWLERNHARAQEVVAGYHKRGTGKPSMTWPESVAEALCYGWIDGIRRRLDEERYTIRFTPRRKGSRWSAVNVRMVGELEAAGKMTEAGRAAFFAWRKTGAEGYAHRRREAELDGARVRRFKKDQPAWAFFEAQPRGYRRIVSWWVMSAKREETREKRLARLMAVSGAGKRLA